MKKLWLFLALTALAVTACTQPADQAAQANMAVAQRFVDEVWNQGNLDVADEILATDFVRHNPESIQPSEVQGIDAFKAYVSSLREQYPDFQVTINASMAKGNMTASRWTVTGTDQQSGNAVNVSGMSMNRYADGKLAEEWSTWDTYLVMQQLGMASQPEMSDK